MGETIANNKKAFHDTSRQKSVLFSTLLASKITSIGNITIGKENLNG